MRSFILRSLVGGIIAAWSTLAAAQVADLVLVNGKVVTVDNRFSVTEAIAVSGERVVATGRTADIEKLTGPATRVIDLAGRTVIPGLIDNHAHYMRAAEYWHREVRLDGVTTHKHALELIAEKARQSQPGEWVLVLGGWSEEQFTDEKRGFTKDELDAIAPNNPVVLQLIYFRIYANSLALKAFGIDAATADPSGGKIEKGPDGSPTGVINGAGALRVVLARLGEVAADKMVDNARLLMGYLNRVGITAYQDMGGRGTTPAHLEAFRVTAERRQMTVRIFYNVFVEPMNAADVDRVVARIGELKPFQGDDWLDMTGFGENVFVPVTDNLLTAAAKPAATDMQQWQRVARAVADRGLHFNVHAQLRGTIEAFLAEIEAINKAKPIKGLRWTFSHLDQVEARDLDRMKRLDMYAQIHSRPSIQGALMLKVHGERTYHMPPLRLIRDSGVPWGLGSDATAVTPVNPFYTLWWAVTGKMLGGQKVLDETISREDALIAHTRSNAAFLFEDGNLGSLAPGKYADLLVLDRDYLTVPEEEIKDIRPTMTIVSGKVVYDATAR